MQCMWNHGRPGQGAGQELEELGLGLAGMGVILLKSLVSKSGPIPSLHGYILWRSALQNRSGRWGWRVF